MITDEDLARAFRKKTGDLNRALKRRKLENRHEYYYRLTRDEYVAFHQYYSVTRRWCDSRRHPVTLYTLKGVALLCRVFRHNHAHTIWQRLFHILAYEEWLAFKMLADDDNSY